MKISDSVRRNAILLALFSVITAGSIAATYIGTRDSIERNRRAVEEATLLELVPRSRHDNSMLDEAIFIDDRNHLGLRSPHKAYVARQAGEPVAVILPATAPDGYSGSIQLLVGIWADGRLAGVRVIEHRETPGLGDKVELKKSDWVLAFTGKSLRNPLPERWGVRKDKGDFDQFTGATITPRAVTAAVYRSLQYFEAHRDSLFGTAEADPTPEITP